MFSEPQDVVADRRLSREQKLAILRRWELDALRLSTSESEGMGGGEESMLSRVGNAIRAVADLPDLPNPGGPGLRSGRRMLR